MISTTQATELILAHSSDWGTVSLPFEQCLGRILAEPILADRDFPPFDRVTMDGIGIAFKAYEGGQRRFPIRGIQPAGAAALQLPSADACLEVMTGAVMPSGVDSIIRYEDLLIENHQAAVQIEQVQRGQNVHPKGSDRKQGDTIVPAGSRIGASEIGLAATVGNSTLQVRRLPRVAVIATGDELVDVHALPAPYQIRSSNGHQIAAQLQAWGLSTDKRFVGDSLAATVQCLRDSLEQSDALILSGGVSKGKFDYVPEALAQVGVKQVFHQVAQRPGKPFWFGVSPAGKPVFALPGNPVSAYMCTVRYVQPWLRKSLGEAPMTPVYAALSAPFSFQPALTYFLQVHTHFDPANGCLMADPISGKGSGDLANLGQTNGFLELPADQSNFEKGAVYPVWLFGGA
ncbi:MAG TPA: molybdopterin molybdotransferase MoeA [Saprospiraceae bacterium]|nr:molybdopterin molybdotransferase MoeA [Saprospiraceae bacterium]HMQ83447.1 molybdopterin molybdotransferase MoeA [Saprospiraceae bacterium]